MCTIGLISNANQNTVTEIPNRFIDEFMSEANGTYVKVYLYLLRHLSDRRDFSVSAIAELLDCTENFLFKALNYWSKQGILEYTVSGRGTVESINLFDLSGYAGRGRAERASEEPVPAPRKKETAVAVNKTPAQKIDLDAMADDENVPFILSTLEQYLARPLSRDDADTAIYIYAGLGFSCDLLFYLYERCIDSGKTSPKYINKVALSWNERGITTIEEAETEFLLNGEAFRAVSEEFGLTGSLGVSQLRFLRCWVNEWHMSAELIREACSRAMLRKGASFQYANSILKSWHDAGARTLADIAKLDDAHKAEEDARHKAPATRTAAKKPNLFNDFTQREYTPGEMAEIEKRMRAKK